MKNPAMFTPRFEVFQDKRGGWKWRLRARNNRIIAMSGEVYTRCRDAVRAAMTVKDTMTIVYREKRYVTIVK